MCFPVKLKIKAAIEIEIGRRYHFQFSKGREIWSLIMWRKLLPPYYFCCTKYPKKKFFFFLENDKKKFLSHFNKPPPQNPNFFIRRRRLIDADTVCHKTWNTNNFKRHILPNHLLVEPRYYHSDESKITLLPWPW